MLEPVHINDIIFEPLTFPTLLWLPAKYVPSPLTNKLYIPSLDAIYKLVGGLANGMWLYEIHERHA